MLRVLHIIPNLNKGGAERLVLDICNELKKRDDIEVKLICFHENNAYSFLTDSIDYSVVPASVSLSVKGKPRVDVEILQKAIQEFEPDVVHSHLFETEIVMSELNIFGAKHFSHFHDNMVQFERPSLSTLFNKTKFTNAFERRHVIKSYHRKETELIGVSNDCFRFIKENLPKSFKSHLQLNAINLDRFESKEHSRQPNRIVTIGSLVEKKGHTLAIETIVELKKRGLFYSLEILGDGPLRRDLENYCQDLQISDQIIFHGLVDYPELIMESASLYLHTASYEPFGLVLIEAMAAGLPVICTDGIGNRDLIQNSLNGFMVSERKPTLLADKIELLSQDSELLESMRKDARKFSLSYDIKNYVDKLLLFYRG